MKKIKFIVLLISVLMVMTMLFTACDETTQCEHNYTSKVTTEATCTKDGVKTFTCSVCKDSYTEAIAATGKHNYTSKVTTEATCTKDGVKTFTCSVCNDSYTEAIAATGHTVNTNNVCTVCRQQALPMTKQEIEIAKKITDIRITYDLSNDKEFWIRLRDENNNQYIAPFIIEIKIVNDNGKTVYNETKNIKSEDFQQNGNANVPGPLAKILLSKEDIVKDTVDTGTVYFKIYNPGYFITGENGERKAQVSGLMEKLELPKLPDTISSSTTSVKITNITYEVSSDNLYIYFTGEKTYDTKGSSYSRACKVGWKLYDSEGFLVDSGVFYTDALKVGEKFKNAKEYCWDVVEPSMTYRLELLNVNG